MLYITFVTTLLFCSCLSIKTMPCDKMLIDENAPICSISDSKDESIMLRTRERVNISRETILEIIKTLKRCRSALIHDFFTFCDAIRKNLFLEDLAPPYTVKSFTYDIAEPLKLHLIVQGFYDDRGKVPHAKRQVIIAATPYFNRYKGTDQASLEKRVAIKNPFWGESDETTDI